MYSANYKIEGNSSPDAEPDAPLRAAVTRAIRHCKLSREQVAEAMSERLRCRVTVHMLNAFTSEANRGARFPLCFFDALCEATGSKELRRFFLDSEDRQLLKLGELDVERKSLLRPLRKRKRG